jgi:hypothetical protein
VKENSIKNERSSIEEAVKTMEHWVEYEKNNKDKINKADELIYIQEIVLSDYKRVLKENEELKEEREIVGIPVRNKRDGKIGIVLHQWKNGSVAVLESINPRVINTHDSWNTLEIVTDEVKQTQTKCETIPVSLVKDKIEELKKKVEELTDEKGYWGGSDLLEQIKVLQELLEKEQ